MDEHRLTKNPNLDEIMDIDKEVKKKTKEEIEV